MGRDEEAMKPEEISAVICKIETHLSELIKRTEACGLGYIEQREWLTWCRHYLYKCRNELQEAAACVDGTEEEE